MGYYGKSTRQRTAPQVDRHCQRTRSLEMNRPCSPRRVWVISDVRLGDNWNAAARSVQRDGTHEVDLGAFADLSRCSTRGTRWMSAASEVGTTALT